MFPIKRQLMYELMLINAHLMKTMRCDAQRNELRISLKGKSLCADIGQQNNVNRHTINIYVLLCSVRQRFAYAKATGDFTRATCRMRNERKLRWKKCCILAGARLEMPKKRLPVQAN